MASCNLCNSFGPTKIQYNYDLATAHAKTHFLQLKLIDEDIDTNQIFGQCFPDFEPVNAETRSGNYGRRELFALCRFLFSHKSSTTHVVCKKCDEKIKIIDRRKHLLYSNVLIEHACRHLGLEAYECLHCILQFNSKTGLSAHLARKHQVRSLIGHFRSKVDDFVGEISAMIKACFGNNKKTANSEGVMMRSASKIRRHTKGSHLAVERQLLCYRLAQKAIDQNGNVQCRLCSKRIRAAEGNSVRCGGIRDHAYRHLPTPLFRCRICSEAYFNSETLAAHLRAVHALPGLEKNYECLADQYHSEILVILKKCFSNDTDTGKEVAVRNLSESKICRKTGRSELAIRRDLLCHQLIRKRVNAEGLVDCRLCSKQIYVKLRNAITSITVMEHALLHLGKKFYQCNKRPNSYLTRQAVRKHLRNMHALPLSDTNYQCAADQFHGDIVSTLHQCFGEEALPEEVRSSVKHESTDVALAVHSYLTKERLRLCSQLARECGDRELKTVQCRMCNKCMSVKNSKCAMDHALGHLETPLYRCKICSVKFVTGINVGHHVRTKHSLPAANNYECLGDQFHAEIVEMLRKCYNKEPANEAKPFDKSRARAEAILRGRTDGTHQSVERQLFCHRLIRKFVKADGKVECRLCKKGIAAKHGVGYTSATAMRHAMVHLKKPIYRCMICSENCSDLGSVNRHLNRTHGLKNMANNYVSLADEYDSEILAKLRECYGEL